MTSQAAVPTKSEPAYDDGSATVYLGDGRIAQLFCRGDYVWHDGNTWRGQVTRVARDGSWVDVWFDQGDGYGWGARLDPSELTHA